MQDTRELDNLKAEIQECDIVKLNQQSKLFVAIDSSLLLNLLETYTYTQITPGIDSPPPKTEDLAEALGVRFVLVHDSEFLGDKKFRILQDVQI